MNLIDYLKTQQITYEDFARQLHVATARTVQRYATGVRIPRPDVMARIHAITDGQVGPRDFYDIGAAPVSPQQPEQHVPP